VKTRDLARQIAHHCFGNLTALEYPIQSRRIGELAHLHRILDGLSRRIHYWRADGSADVHHAEIKCRSKPGIDAHFFIAGCMAFLQGGKIHERQFDGFFNFVCKCAG